MEEKLPEKEILERLKKYLPEFRARKMKVISRKYLKYKEEKHWARAPITNLDKERRTSLNPLKVILESLFEEVTLAPMKVPFVCLKDGRLYELPNHFEDRVLVCRKLKPIFEVRYKGIDSKTSEMVSVYLGEGYTFYYYQDKNSKDQVIDKLLGDIKYLHVFSSARRIPREKLNKLILRYYSDVFQKIPQAPAELKEGVEKLPEKRVEAPEILEAPKAEVEAPKVRKRVKKKTPKPVEIFSTDYERVNSKEIQKIISEYKPQPLNFFGVVAKTRYENLLKQIKEEEKRMKVDYLFYQFIKLSEGKATKELYSQFSKKLDEL